MGNWEGATIMDYFESLDDPRVDRGKRHKLVDLIAIAISAVICDADSWVYVEMFGKSKEEWFRTFLELPHGISSHDTFGDVFLPVGRGTVPGVLYGMDAGGGRPAAWGGGGY